MKWNRKKYYEPGRGKKTQMVRIERNNRNPEKPSDTFTSFEYFKLSEWNCTLHVLCFALLCFALIPNIMSRSIYALHTKMLLHLTYFVLVLWCGVVVVVVGAVFILFNLSLSGSFAITLCTAITHSFMPPYIHSRYRCYHFITRTFLKLIFIGVSVDSTFGSMFSPESKNYVCVSAKEPKGSEI